MEIGFSKGIRWAVVSWIYLLIVMVLLIPKVSACTLWSAAGESVVDGGTLIAKNRDWLPDHQQQFELSSIRGSGYRYLGLVAYGNDSPGLKAGVNSKGFVVVSASPPSYLEKDKSLKRVPGICRKLLADCKTVKGALSRRQWFVGPEFLMLADSNEIAIVEIGLDGMFRVKSTKSGLLSQSNHYLHPELINLNRDKPGLSSVKRLEKIQWFLASKETFELDDFIQISASTDAGPDNSLWRTGSKPTSARTLATWIIRQVPSGEALLYLKMANPSKEIKEYRFKLRDVFNGKVNVSGVE
jgi:isopenicillin-N N-acyltransferase-like protein